MSTDTEKSSWDEKWEAHRRAPKFRHIIRELEGKLEREQYVYSTPEGAVELWRALEAVDFTWSRTGYYGGVEYHSPKPHYEGQQPMEGHCPLVWGGTCYVDGSSMAFEQFETSFDAPEYIKHELAYRHASQFEEDES